jgi:galactokinase
MKLHGMKLHGMKLHGTEPFVHCLELKLNGGARRTSQRNGGCAIMLRPENEKMRMVYEQVGS